MLKFTFTALAAWAAPISAMGQAPSVRRIKESPSNNINGDETAFQKPQQLSPVRCFGRIEGWRFDECLLSWSPMIKRLSDRGAQMRVALFSFLALFGANSAAQVQPLPPDPLRRAPEKIEPVRPGTGIAPGTSVQVKPAPGKGPAVQGVTPVPQLTVQTGFRPEIKVKRFNGGDFLPGATDVLNIEISGLTGAKAVHLLYFAPSCAFAQTVRLAGDGPRLNLISDEFIGKDALWSSDPTFDYTRTGDKFVVTRYDSVGVPVPVDGKVRFHLAGRLLSEALAKPASFNAQTAAAASNQGDLPATGYFPFIHVPTVPFRSSTQVQAQRDACNPKAGLVVKGADDVWRAGLRDGTWQPISQSAMEISTPVNPILLQQRRRVIIENTYALKDLLQPKVVPYTGVSPSSCSGDSLGAAGSIPVGVVERGGDLAFHIRSGPLGTDCRVSTEPGVLPQGAYVEEATFSVSKTGDRCVANSTMSSTQFTVGSALAVFYGGAEGLAAVAYQLATGESVPAEHRSFAAIDSINAKQRYPARGLDIQTGTKTYLNMSVHAFLDVFKTPQQDPTIGAAGSVFDRFEPFHAFLSCNETLTNDNAVTLKLDQVVIMLPPGASFP